MCCVLSSISHKMAGVGHNSVEGAEELILVCGRIWSLQHETQYRTGLHHRVGDKDVGISARLAMGTSEATAASSVATDADDGG